MDISRVRDSNLNTAIVVENENKIKFKSNIKKVFITCFDPSCSDHWKY